MPRPRGQFDANKEKVFTLIQSLSHKGSCFATSRYLAGKMECGEKQIQRYLHSLRTEGRIRILTGKPLSRPEGGFYRKRFIKITPQQEVAVSDPGPDLDDDTENQIAQALASLSDRDRAKAEADSYYADLLRELEAEVGGEANDQGRIPTVG